MKHLPFLVCILAMLVACAPQSPSHTDSNDTDGRADTYTCDNNNAVTVLYGRYMNGGSMVELAESEVVLLDRQTGAMHVLIRTKAASGEKYQNGEGLVFWLKAESAIVMDGESVLYEHCRTTQ